MRIVEFGSAEKDNRRVDDANRLVYEIVAGEIVMKSCKGHYED